MNIQYIHPADQLVMFMQRIYDKGMTTMSGGNLSIKDSDGNVWITPGSVDKGTLTRKDIICVHPDGTMEGPHKPSSELPFHLSVYKMRPDLSAVLHAHPPALVAFSVVRKTPNLDLLPTVRQICKDAQIATYDVPGSEALADQIGKVFARGCDIAILENHGVCVGAPDMFTAFQRFETLNYTAQLEILASKLGKIQALPEDAYLSGEANFRVRMDDFIPHSYTSEELAARRDMITLIHRSYQMGLFTATHGTYSVRLSDGSILITPYGLDRAYLREEDLVRIKAGMKEVGKEPSRAVGMHQKIYEVHPDVNAILLAQPVHAMAFAVTDAKFDARTIPESYIQLRNVKKLPYEDIYKNPDAIINEFTPTHPAAIVENDCVIVTGSNLLNAFDRLEVMESTANSILNTCDLGDIVHISDKEIEDLKVAFNFED
ncbi:MAG: class II aldolase/adducin family protein [Oscillospiraceae bacterium]|nr:class II aldolase/adducin family protein [Oscillospiraceae bacterium]